MRLAGLMLVALVLACGRSPLDEAGSVLDPPAPAPVTSPPVTAPPPIAAPPGTAPPTPDGQAREDCAEVQRQYAAALPIARRCNPTQVAQCTYSAPIDLGCNCPSVRYNDPDPVTAIFLRWRLLGCDQVPHVCVMDCVDSPDSGCVGSGGDGVCQGQ